MIKESVIKESKREDQTKSKLVEDPKRKTYSKPSEFQKHAEGALYVVTIYGVIYGIPALLIGGVGYGVYRFAIK